MAVVRAAGGIPVRETPNGLEVLVVHRPRYRDWTFPKGKRERGETDEECALREIREETGLDCALEDELPSTSYRDARGRPKEVRYWRLRVVGGELRYDHEVDEARWLGLEEAETILSYERDVAVLRALAVPHSVSDFNRTPDVPGRGAGARDAAEATSQVGSRRATGRVRPRGREHPTG